MEPLFHSKMGEIRRIGISQEDNSAAIGISEGCYETNNNNAKNTETNNNALPENTETLELRKLLNWLVTDPHSVSSHIERSISQTISGISPKNGPPSKLAKLITTKLLVVDQNSRCSAAEALQVGWMK